MADVDFYFTYGCPWTYLAFTRLREAAMRTNARIVWKPILVERVRRVVAGGAAAGQADAVPARVRYQSKDLADWARFCGVTLRRAEPFPVPAEWALRGAVVVIPTGKVVPYSEAVFRMCFEDVADINTLDVLVPLAVRAGVDEVDFRRAACDGGALRAVERYSDELVDRGGFGSPTMFIGSDMYFGNDRMPLVELALGRAAGRPLIVPGAHGQT